MPGQDLSEKPRTTSKKDQENELTYEEKIKWEDEWIEKFRQRIHIEI